MEIFCRDFAEDFAKSSHFVTKFSRFELQTLNPAIERSQPEQLLINFFNLKNYFLIA